MLVYVPLPPNAEEESWAHRIFKRDIRVQPGADMVEETLKLLKRRRQTKSKDKPRRVTEMMRRGVMTFMEIFEDHLLAWSYGTTDWSQPL